MCQSLDWSIHSLLSEADSIKDAGMKTVVDLEPELYAAVERLAQSQQKGLGQVVSELLRRALGLSKLPEAASVVELERGNGFDVFPARMGPKATGEGVQRLCHEEGI